MRLRQIRRPGGLGGLGGNRRRRMCGLPQCLRLPAISIPLESQLADSDPCYTIATNQRA
jgi:hypothetical protein